MAQTNLININSIKELMKKPEFWVYVGEYERRKKKEYYQNLGFPPIYVAMLCSEGYRLLLIYQQQEGEVFIPDFVSRQILKGALDNKNIEVINEWITENGAKYKNTIYLNKKVKKLYYKREYLAPSCLYTHIEIYIFVKLSLI